MSTPWVLKFLIVALAMFACGFAIILASHVAPESWMVGLVRVGAALVTVGPLFMSIAATVAAVLGR